MTFFVSWNYLFSLVAYTSDFCCLIFDLLLLLLFFCGFTDNRG